MEERLQKYLAKCGVASRRKCEEYILQGKVKVNGELVTELGRKVNPQKDTIQFENKRDVKLIPNTVYLMNHITCRAVLVECGFLTNPEDERLLAEDNYQRKFASVLSSVLLKERENAAAQGLQGEENLVQ